MSDELEPFQGMLDDAASVLLLAPTLEPPDDRACIELLAPDGSPGVNVLSVTVSESPGDRLVVWQQQFGESLPERAAIVGMDGSESRRTGAAADDLPITVDLLSTPVDPVEFASRITQHLGRWEETPEPTRVCIHSVTALLDSLDLPAVVRLTNVLNDRFASTNAVGHYHMDSAAHDEETLTELRPLFDVVVEYAGDHGWTATRHERGAPPFGGVDPDSEPDETVGSAVDHPTLRRSFDTVIDLLSAPERRALLYYFHSQDADEVQLDVLADRIRAFTRTPGDSLEASLEGAIETSLVHVHLPKLEEAGVVDVDRDTRTVRYNANPALETCVKHAMTLELDGHT